MPGLVRRVHQPGQARPARRRPGAARTGVQPVVAPVAVAREGRDRTSARSAVTPSVAQLRRAGRSPPRRCPPGVKVPTCSSYIDQLARRHGPPQADRLRSARQVQRRATGRAPRPAASARRDPAGRRRRPAPAGSRRRRIAGTRPANTPSPAGSSGWSPPSSPHVDALRPRGPHPEDGRAVGLRAAPSGSSQARRGHSSGVSQITARGAASARPTAARRPTDRLGLTRPGFPRFEPP